MYALPQKTSCVSVLTCVFIACFLTWRICLSSQQPRFSSATGDVQYQWVLRTDSNALLKNIGDDLVQSSGNSLTYAHMSTIERLPDGSISVAFQGSVKSYEGSNEQAIYWRKSLNGGRSWLSLKLIVAGDNVPVWSPVLLVEAGRVWLFYTRSNRKCRYFDRRRGVPRHSPGGDILYVTSDDSGDTWTAPQMIYAYEEEGGVSKVIANKAVVLSNGEWVLPFWREAGRTCPSAHKGSSSTHLISGSAGVLISDDQGLTWSVHGHIQSTGTSNYTGWLIENALVELPGQQLLQLFRSKDGALYQSWSANAGRNWSIAQRTSIVNPDSKVSLLRISLNTRTHLYSHIVCAYNRSPQARTPLYIAISNDPYARQWVDVVAIEVAEAVDFSYPSMLETTKNLLTTYSVMTSENGLVHSRGIKISRVAKNIF